MKTTKLTPVPSIVIPRNSSNSSYNSKSDLQLVRLVRSKADSESFNEICSRYENIFYKICQRYANTLSAVGIDPRDIFEEKNTIILHCVQTFNPKKKTKLSTFIGNYARYLCLNSINSRKFIRPSTPEGTNKFLEEHQQKNNFFSPEYSKEDFQYISNLLDQLKDKRIKDIIYLRHFNGNKKMTWSEIAKRVSLSTQTALTLHNRGIELLKNKIKSNNISDII